MDVITPGEKQQLESRLAALVANRPVVTNRIAEARALGDLKENGDYHAAREQQGMEEAEIKRLQQRLATAQVVDEQQMEMAKADGVVFLGAIVKLEELGTGDTDSYKLVGEASNDPLSEHIEVTASSPMGESLLKARVGSTIRVNAPRGMKQFKIVEIL
jgi:transcription elongation factor GreA